VHDKDGMAVSEIMAATEATNRNAIDILLHKMRVEGQIIRVRRGVYMLPSESGKIGQKERNATKLRENPHELGNLSNLSDLSNNGFIAREPSESTQ
jgi:hypothetical protein